VSESSGAPPGPPRPGCCPQAAADGKTVRGAVRPDGSHVHLLSVFDPSGTIHGGCSPFLTAATNQPMITLIP
jgi:hypothetical protein